MKRKGLTNREMREAGMKIANPNRVRADQELRRSSAARGHDSRPHRQRSRAASRSAAVEEG